MTIDTILSLMSLAISVGGLVAAGLRRETIFAIIAAGLIITTGTVSWRLYQQEREIWRAQNEIITKLASNAWTLDRIYTEVHFLPYKVIHEALFQAVDSGAIHDKEMECTVNDGSVLSTKVYYVATQP